MAVSHVERPVFGVQFHPESIGSQHGKRLLANFLKRVARQRRKKS
jgi:anthranilate/para-aminobenzoate synthase component II